MLFLAIDEVTRVKVSDNQRCFRDLTFFGADLENMKEIRPDQLCFRPDQLCFRPDQLCFRPDQFYFRPDQLWFSIFSESTLFRIENFSAVQRFSGNEQHWNRPEIILNQSWSELNVWDINPGMESLNNFSFRALYWPQPFSAFYIWFLPNFRYFRHSKCHKFTSTEPLASPQFLI